LSLENITITKAAEMLKEVVAVATTSQPLVKLYSILIQLLIGSASTKFSAEGSPADLVIDFPVIPVPVTISASLCRAKQRSEAWPIRSDSQLSYSSNSFFVSHFLDILLNQNIGM
jgi:hypothetical protein